ncbi:ABC transporter ATP-binding protein [Aeromonas hydrophila]|uniref:ABC transporter ATP-binding protein n=1 Tax=Aeromonas hydrophila TaxID=644 RepID=A0A068FT60_AERHY|nr:MULTISPECIES: ABC transporter ATP-binding protein [Gammaproteobacteria]AID71054.1 ABC transporter ATP-binding protein [Aeromonas hydrophila]EFE7253530.1 ABC transporter ATP-binding protein [Escherichia coli]EFH8447451.1 ABC transporter ATP-binding protein [Escherichia coli]EFM3272930.1 ABC transporter ATP-binding protein [Escherichia coli]EGI6872482.1 ABC transporter ATP-binding protein [Escherichia coli]
MSSNNIAISVKDISKKYDMFSSPFERLLSLFSIKKEKHKEFLALKNVTFEVNKGETVGILGRNGSGKSTLLQIIAGTLNPTDGDVNVNGRLAALLELGSGFNPEFTGRENVYLNGSILGFTHEQMKGKFSEIESFADIGDHIDQPVKTYSSGMAVRLAFAVQACIKPDVLIVDEALAVGDEKFQRKCFEYIESLRENGCSILLVTHSTSTVEKFCQRAVLLNKGNVEGIGAAKEIVDQYHALLYSDEKTYARYLNSLLPNEISSPNVVNVPEETRPVINDDISDHANESLSNDALITKWGCYDANSNPCEVYRVGEVASVEFEISSLGNINELQAGILIRTIEGVSVFGTSTLYHNMNIHNLRAGEKAIAKFALNLNLCEGTYFVTLAIAESISHADMRYLDKKTDVLIMKVFHGKTTMSGIAALPVNVSLKAS